MAYWLEREKSFLACLLLGILTSHALTFVQSVEDDPGSLNLARLWEEQMLPEERSLGKSA